MPKNPRRSKARVRKARRPKRTATVRRLPTRTRALADDETNVDGCDIEFTASDATPDAELPKATGGVETVPRGRR